VSEQQLIYLTRIGHNMNRLTRIINQLLDWSRLDSKRDMLFLTPIHVETTALLVADSLRTVAAEKMITIETVHSDGLPPVRGDQDKLEQILWNLIGNAIKFTPPGGRITVDFKTTPEGFVQTSVADTGCGIDPGSHGKALSRVLESAVSQPHRSGSSAWLVHYQKPGDDASGNHLGREYARSRDALLFHPAHRAVTRRFRSHGLRHRTRE
jgi:Signal transduction histidine kinase